MSFEKKADFFVEPTVLAYALIKEFKIQGLGQQRERSKTIGLISKTTTSYVHHPFLYISFLFLHDYEVEMPNFPF